MDLKSPNIGSTTVVGEAKFITNIGGTQNNSFEDVKKLLRCKFGSKKVPKDNIRVVGIVDGVPYIPSNNKIYKFLKTTKKDIFSALFLIDYLNSIY